MGIERTGLDIIIRTKAELDGVQALEASLERQIGKAKALGQDYSALEEKLKRVKTVLADTGPLEDFKKQADGAAKSSKALGVEVDDVSDKLGKKLFSAGALAIAAFRGMHAAINFVAPAFDGVRAAAGRLYTALQESVVSSGIFQGSVAGIRVALEALAEFVESKVTPKMLALANKVRDVATAYSDAAKAAADLLTIQREFAADEEKRAKGVEKEIKGIDAWLGRQKEVLAALRENEKARINFHEKDPVAREKKLADADRRFDAQGHRLEDEAANKKGVIVQKEIGRLDEEILAAGAQLPEMGTLPKLAQDAQDRAREEEAALRENRRNFVIRERIRQMGGASVSGRTSFAQMATKDREELNAEDQLVYDFVDRSGGMEAAVPAIDQALKGSRARVNQSKAARVDAFGRLPRGVGTPAEAANYEKGMDQQMRGRIQGLQEKQDTFGERGEEFQGGKVQRGLVTPIQDNTRDLDASRREMELEWDRLKETMREYDSSNRRKMREYNDEMRQLMKRGAEQR